MDKKETKFCIYCGEEIPISAKKCKYCYEWIDDDSVSRNHDPAIYKSETNENKEEIQKEGLKQEKYPGEEEYYKNEKIAISSSKIKSQNKEEYSKIIPIRRLFLLITFTFGLYGYYWYYKNTSYLKDYLGMDIRVGLRTFFMFIPIVNIIFFYQLLEDMKNFIQGEGIESYSSGLNTLIWLFLGSWFGTLGMWTLINVQ
ncbi:MAG: DUF4234 domain-containing protein, partial [Methanobrevibacter sp.]|nr:DUF4234 domain-containing protein [Methanobrevibacter sp.]